MYLLRIGMRVNMFNQYRDNRTKDQIFDKTIDLFGDKTLQLLDVSPGILNKSYSTALFDKSYPNYLFNLYP